MRDALPDGIEPGILTGAGRGIPRLAKIRGVLVKARLPLVLAGYRAFDPAPVLPGFAVPDHALPASSALVLADSAGALPALGDRPGTDDGDI